MEKQTLDLASWAFLEPKSRHWLKAHVPSCIHTDLVRHKLIPVSFPWIERQWIEECDFRPIPHRARRILRQRRRRPGSRLGTARRDRGPSTSASISGRGWSKPALETLGLFDIKEHFVSVGLALLPAYWVCWRRPRADESARIRAALTAVLAVIVWWSFLIGHVLNNLRGFGS